MKHQRTRSTLVLTATALAMTAAVALADGQADRRNEQIQYEGAREAVYDIQHMEPTAAGRRSMDRDQMSLEEREEVRQQLHDRQDTNSAYQIKRAVFGGEGNR
ncbi:hypothetical protein QQM79_01175 [Marinobacteraceae bacterium S3BR75-40.1]